VVNYGTPDFNLSGTSCELKDSLVNCRRHKHKLFLSYILTDLRYIDNKTPQTYYAKREKRNINKLQKFLDKRLSEVKVLIIMNPTTCCSHDTSMTINYDTLVAPIYKIHFKKMTSLREVYLFGNDSDQIREMPNDFYSTPVTTVYTCNIAIPDRLKKNIQKKRKDIIVINGWYDDILK
jgi:hypothetical protein